MNHRISQEDFDAAIEAAEQRGAETAVAELIAAARRTTASFCGGDPRSAVPHFCGGIEAQFMDLAVEIAKAAGMGQIYADMAIKPAHVALYDEA